MDYQEFIQELTDAHDDTIEILSEKLRSWIEDAGSTTFNLSTGDVTVQNMPNILAGTTTFTAGETVSAGDPIKIYDDGGTTKVDKIDGSLFVNSSMATGSAERIFYSSDYDRAAYIYEGSSNDIQILIGTKDSDNQLTFGSEIEVYSGGTSVSSVKISKITNSIFVVSWIDNENVYMKTCKFTSATVISFGALLNTSLTNVQGFDIASDDATTLNLITLDDDTTNQTIYSRIYTVNTTTLGITFTASSNKEILDILLSSSLVTPDSYVVGYNSDDSIFHCIYSYSDGSNTKLMHVSVNKTSGVLLSPQDEIFSVTAGTGFWHPRGIFYDTNNSQVIVLLPTATGTTTRLVYLMRMTVSSGSCTPIQLTEMHSYKSKDVGDYYAPSTMVADYISSLGEMYVIYRPDGLTESYIIQYNIEFNNDKVKTFRQYQSSKLPSKGIDKFDNVMTFGAIDGTSTTLSFDERSIIAGIALESKVVDESISISLLGYQADAFSGLIIGSRYYLQSDLSITTTKNEYPIGIAITTTSMKLF